MGVEGTEIVTNNVSFGNAVTNAAYSIVQVGYTGTGNLDADTLFVSASDLHMESVSPAINTGTNTGAPATDIEGNVRPL